MQQNLYLPAVQMLRNAEKLLEEGKLKQAAGLTYVADFNLQFLVHEIEDPAANAARQQSLANPAKRPMFTKALKFGKQGIDALKHDPRRALALYRIASVYNKLADSWEPGANDDKTREESAKLDGFLNRQLEVARKAVTALPPEPKDEPKLA